MAKATNPLIKEACIQLYFAGKLTMQEIADHFEVQRSTVSRWIRMYVNSQPQKPNRSAQTCDKVFAINYNLDRLEALHPDCKDQQGTILTLRGLFNVGVEPASDFS